MRILVTDFLFSPRHRFFNARLLQCISNNFDTTIIAPELYFSDYKQDISNAHQYDFPLNISFSKSKILSRIRSLTIMRSFSRFSRDIVYDAILITAFDTLSFALAPLILPKSKDIFLIHHNNIDGLQQMHNSISFNLYKNSVFHVVLEDYLKEYLIECFHIDKDRVFVLPHPVDNHPLYPNRSYKYLCCGLSNSNDDSIIAELINIERTSSCLKQLKLKIILKSRRLNFSNGYLYVFNEYLSPSAYEEYYANSRYVFLPFPPSYKYRVSGTMHDAISHGKPIIGLKSPLFSHYNAKYPNFCRVVDDVTQFITEISRPEINDNNNLNSEIRLLKKLHSSDNIISSLRNIFHTYKN